MSTARSDDPTGDDMGNAGGNAGGNPGTPPDATREAVAGLPAMSNEGASGASPAAEAGSRDATGRALYTSEQQRILRTALVAGTLPDCPACGGAMTRRPIGGGSFGLGYARKREWLLCAACHRSAIFDVRRGTRT